MKMTKRFQHFISANLSTVLGLTVTALLLGVSGCVSKPPMPSAVRTVTYKQPAEAVWQAVLQEAATINTNLVADWTLGTVKVAPAMIYEAQFPIRDYAYEPAGVGKHWSSSRVQADFRVREISPSETQVTVDCRFFRYDANADAAWRPWVSNGYYEQYLLKQIQGRLPQ